MPQVTAQVWATVEPGAAFAVSQTTGALRLRWDPFIRSQHFLDGATQIGTGTLTATGRVVSVDGRVATCTGEVRHEDGTLCATGRATFMYLPGSEKPEGVPREPAQAVG